MKSRKTVFKALALLLILIFLPNPVSTDADGDSHDAPGTTLYSDWVNLKDYLVDPDPESGTRGLTRSSGGKLKNLDAFLDSIEITGAEKNEEGKYVIINGVPYTVQLFFSEKTNGVQFDDDGPLTYEFPDGFTPPDTNGTVDMTGSGGVARFHYDISKNTETGKSTLTVVFDKNSPGYSSLITSENIQFEIHVKGIISLGKIIFSSVVSGEFEFDDTRKVSVQKTGSYDAGLNKIKYTVQAYSKGNNENVHIGDIITGTALTYDPGSLTVSSDIRDSVVYNPDTRSGETFGLTIPSMTHGETVTVEYYADVNLGGLTRTESGVIGTITETENTVKIHSDFDPTGNEITISGNDFRNQISLSGNSKTASSQVVREGKTYVTWTIVLNENANISIAGKTVTDVIDPSSQQFMRYSGYGIHIEKYEKNGTSAGSDDIRWGANGLSNGYGGSTWNYTIPASDKDRHYKYVITYETEVDSDAFLKTTVVNNTVFNDYDTDYSGINIDPTGEKVQAAKTAVQSTVDPDKKEAETEWEITFTVPATGLDSAEIIDSLPGFLDSATRTWFYDTLKSNSVRTGDGDLVRGESFSVDTTSQDHTVMITFTRNNGEPGLTGTGQTRTIHVYLTTTVSHDWLVYAETQSRARTHVNNAIVRVNGQDISVIATASYNTTKYDLEKIQDKNGPYSTSTNPALPIYTYRIILTNVNQNAFGPDGYITITDTFNSKYLAFHPIYDTNDGNNVNTPNGHIYGNNQWNKYELLNTNKGGYVVGSYSDGQIIFRISPNDLPMIDDSSYYPYYTIAYALQIKDAATLTGLRNEALHSDGLKVGLENTASNNEFGTNTIITDYSIKALDKQLVSKGYNSSTGTYDFHFSISVNPDGLKIGDGNTITLKDTVSNLSFDYTSIAVSPRLDGDTLDRVGNSLVFTLHNATPYTITYTARLVGLENIQWNNQADLYGYTSGVNGTSTLESGGSGTYPTYSMNIKKYAEGDMNHGLGATFELYEARVKEAGGKDIQDPEWKKVGEFTTDATTGLFQIKTVIREGSTEGQSLRFYSVHDKNGKEEFGSEGSETYGWRYRVKEIAAPDGYQRTSTEYEFGISDIPSYTAPYNYLNNDTVTIVNKPFGPHGTLTVTKELSSNISGQDDKAYPITIRVTDGGVEKFVNAAGEFVTSDPKLAVSVNTPVVIEGLPLDIEYRVAEALGDDETAIGNFTLTASQTTGSVTLKKGENTQEQTVELINNYERNAGSLIIKKSVTVNGHDADPNEDGTYTFTISGAGDALGTTKTVNISFENGRVKSAAADGIPLTPDPDGLITITGLPTGIYTVTEDTTGLAARGMHLLKAPAGTLTVVKDGTGTIQTAEFVNNIPTGSTRLNAVKNISGRDFREGDQWTFTVASASGTPMPANTVVEIEPTSGSQCSIDFGEIHYGLADVGKTYVYEITESGSVDGVTNDSSVRKITVTVDEDANGRLIVVNSSETDPAVFVNTYSATGEGEVKVQKTLSGREWTAEDSFEFTIVPVGDAPAFATDTVTITRDTPDRTASFGKMEFSKAGTYEWTVTEAHAGETIGGVAYDSAPKTVTIVVTDDGKGHLVAEDDSGPVRTVAFTNTYSNTGEAEIKVQKTLSGREWTAEDSFEFTIVPVGNAPAFATDTVTITRDTPDRTASFGNVEFSKAGTYEWTVTEAHAGETIGGVAYDSAPKTVTIVVTDDGKGHLVADDGSGPVRTVEFTNTYSAENTLVIEGVKTLENRRFMKGDILSVTVQGDAKLPDPATTTVPLTEGEDTAVFQFAEIKYDLSDMVDGNGERVYEKEFRYIISEDAAMAGTTVLLGENTLNVKVTDQLDGTLKIEKTYSNGDQVLFINTRDNTVIIRKTDAADGRALEGAAFRITDSEGSVVDEWVSSREEAHVIRGLKTGEEYILHETAAPHGYGIATDTTFTFDGQGNVVSTGTVTYDEEGNWILLVKDDMFKVSASVKKIWGDDNNRDGVRPLNLRVNLMAAAADGTASAVEDADGNAVSVTLTPDNGWAATVKNLPMVDGNQNDITYFWTEEEPGTGYKATSNTVRIADEGKTIGFVTTITNAREPDTTSVSVRKVWDDEENAYQTRPAEIRVQLYANGTACGEAITLNGANEWKYTWTGLTANENPTGMTAVAKAISYTVEELDIPEGYQAAVSGNAEGGFVITNRVDRGKLVIRKTFNVPEPRETEPEPADITVTKVWQDNDNQDGIRPESVTVHLYAGDEMIGTAVLSEATGWRYTFTELPEQDRGNPIRYTVTEDPVEGYICEIDGYTIRNTHTPEETSVTIRKIWDDDNNAAGIRPSSIRATLSNGTSVLLTAENGWQATVSGLPKKADGADIEYTWTEWEIAGYKLEKRETNGTITTLTNVPVSIPQAPEGYKKPKAPSGWHAVFAEYQTALGVEVNINHVGDCFD